MSVIMHTFILATLIETILIFKEYLNEYDQIRIFKRDELLLLIIIEIFLVTFLIKFHKLICFKWEN